MNLSWKEEVYREKNKALNSDKTIQHFLENSYGIFFISKQFIKKHERGLIHVHRKYTRVTPTIKI